VAAAKIATVVVAPVQACGQRPQAPDEVLQVCMPTDAPRCFTICAHQADAESLSRDVNNVERGIVSLHQPSLVTSSVLPA